MGTIVQIRTPSSELNPVGDHAAAVIVDTANGQNREGVLIFGPGTSRLGADLVDPESSRLIVTVLSGGCSLRRANGTLKVVTEGAPTFLLEPESGLEVIVNAGSLCVWLLRPEPRPTRERSFPAEGTATKVDSLGCSTSNPSLKPSPGSGRRFAFLGGGFRQLLNRIQCLHTSAS